MGKDRKGNQRQNDNWGRLGTINTRFISFPAKGEAWLTLVSWRSKTSASLCWAKAPLCQLAVSVGKAPTAPQTWGTEKHISQAQVPIPDSCHAQPWVAADLLGTLLLGSW